MEEFRGVFAMEIRFLSIAVVDEKDVKMLTKRASRLISELLARFYMKLKTGRHNPL